MGWTRSLAGPSRLRLAHRWPAGIPVFAPQVAFLGGLCIAYVVGIAVSVDGLGDRLPIIGAAVALAIVGTIVGLLIELHNGGRIEDAGPRAAAPAARPILMAAITLVGIGVAATLIYFVRIGTLPILLPDLEQARVNASERGGAALRVLGLLALPGIWIVVAAALARPNVRHRVGALALMCVVAVTQILTANRAPAFQALEVSIVVALLVTGRRRFSPRGLAAIGTIGVVIVLAAGVVGAFRLAGRGGETGAVGTYPRLITESIAAYARVSATNLDYTLIAVPSKLGWRLGRTYLQPALTVLPGRQTTFDQDLKAALGQDFPGGGTVPGFLGEAYANFGPPGWLVVPGLVAFILARLYRLARSRDRPLMWTLYAYAIVHAVGALLSGLLVTSPFPLIAYAILGAAAWWDHRRTATGSLPHGAA